MHHANLKNKKLSTAISVRVILLLKKLMAQVS